MNRHENFQDTVVGAIQRRLVVGSPAMQTCVESLVAEVKTAFVRRTPMVPPDYEDEDDDEIGCFYAADCHVRSIIDGDVEFWQRVAEDCEEFGSPVLISVNGNVAMFRFNFKKMNLTDEQLNSEPSSIEF